MPNNYDFKIIIIDDNPEIHKDFVKTLTSFDISAELQSMESFIFGDSDESKSKESSKDQIALPKFKIDTASQGQEGVKKIAQAIEEGTPYALAFVDIRMPPGWDGIKTIKHIWELDKDIQVVICTAFSDYSWEETIKELGQTDNLLILKKPFDQISVRQLASALTRKWKLMKDARQYTHSLEETILARTGELQYQATHDPLTSLPNRTLLADMIEQAIKESNRSKEIFAVLFFDLDRFKLINDSLNHSTGDELLRLLAKRIQSNIRPANTLARLGGDEFVLLVRNVSSIKEVTAFTNNLLATIRAPFMLADHTLTISSSVGISVYPENGETIDILIRNADTAMYKAKELGGNQFQYYTEEMNAASLKALEMETDLRNAVLNNEFTLLYQPQFDLKSNEIESVETLVRWNHPTRGLILPLDFIPLAEETGIIIPIGDWVLREACKQNKSWQDAGLPPIRIAVNITTQQIKQFDFVDKIKQILEETKLDPKYLEIELTENTIVNNVHAVNVLNQLKDLGVQIAIDDFGTGYSSLNHLRNVPLNRLKIDRSFVHNILINKSDEIIITAIIAMANGLNLDVLAEGVETQSQLDFLRKTNCKDIQGFLFSRPLTEANLVKILENKSSINELLEEEKL